MNIATKTSSPDTSTLSDDQQHFVQEISSLLAPWGLSPSAGRVHAYLMLKPAPVSIDQIASDLSMSRVGAWNSARHLETFGHVRRYGTPGSKKALYSAADNFAAPFIEQASLLAAFSKQLQATAATAANDVAAQLHERARFYTSVQNAIVEKIEALNTSKGIE